MTITLPTEALLECDNCGQETVVDLTEFTGDPPTVGHDESELPDGWASKDGEHFCPICNQM